ncbi:hypothetical protein HF888_05305 [Bermanella marisrubri]|uniref:MAPEG family protein n=1 Tax=Bermanella marisrubri TaxID=207949 RepID=Q1N1S8_9GAMM|nr:MAPEG family protein [Bermanella marisrubri]EAT12203.1 hypothetical protein RED65_04235 [Oceanobacter sp. RED65] [Bermanella marisrubri]QIZ83674.1 hypothetical protein HF888_05305 [Bermanella marisrubri]
MELIFPLLAMLALTFTVSFSVGISRLIAIRKRMVNPKYYRVMSGYDEPAWLTQINRNYANLLELPILFYVLVLTALALNIQDTLVTMLAWLFVVLRVVHTCIHVTYNNTLHRMLVFAMSAIVLLVCWIVLVFSIF